MTKELMDNKQLFVIVGPSGSGKTTLGKHLQSLGIPELVSHTTRKMREGELEGVAYHFVTEEEFHKIPKVEQNFYSGSYYCLSEDEVNNRFKEYDRAFVVADINGAEQIKKRYPEITSTIFISVTYNEMIKRMAKRGDSADNISKRINHAITNKELSNGDKCDYIVHNFDYEDACRQIEEIIA